MEAIKYLALVLAVELGSVTKAAEALGYTQSGISHMLNSLEKECEMQLLYRDRAGVHLTAAGEALLPYFQSVCSSERDLLAMLEELRGGKGGLIRVASHTSIAAQWLPGIFESFGAMYPRVRFMLREVITNDEMRHLLHQGTVDCGFTDTDVYDRGLHQVFLYRDLLVVILPPDHPLAGAKYFPMDALDAYPYIKLDETPGSSNEFTSLVDKIFIRYHKSPEIRFSVRDEYTVMAMVENHQGFSILPKMMIWDRPGSQLVQLPLEVPYSRDLSLIMSNRRKDLLLIPPFIEAVKSWVNEKYGITN